MNRITAKLDALRNEEKKALSLFVTAGIPRVEDTAKIIVALGRNGADLVELGIPFSDPIADGPVIQASSDLARSNGVTVETVFSIVEAVRKESDIPIILMGYANPVYRMGLERFLERCSAAGVDGTIIADIPVEESQSYRLFARKHGIAAVFLAAPTSSDARLRLLDESTEGFLYCISVTGVTGARTDIAAEAEEFLIRARKQVQKHPLLAGFGISTPGDAARMARHCDGVIIGSALMKILMQPGCPDVIDQATRFTQSVRVALDRA